jgi:polyphosphate glucokinase
VDIGGTGIKASVLDEEGLMQAERVRVATPVGRHPSHTLAAVAGLARRLPRYDRVSVGFPGVVAAGRVLTAPNLRHPAWLGLDLAGALRRRLGKPTRIANDVTLQGLAAIRGKGVELIVTLGTGVGSALYVDGLLVPQFGLGHHHFRKGRTYDAQLNDAALEQVGKKRWNRRLKQAVASLGGLVHFDRLYIGGGNAKKLDFELDPDVRIVGNEAGLKGGVALWRD